MNSRSRHIPAEKRSGRRRIAFVSDSVYPFNKGGKEKRNYDVAVRLAAAGFDVHVYCMKWWDGDARSVVSEGVRLHAISPLYPLYAGGRRSIWQAVRFAARCLALVFEEFDIVEADHIPQTTLFTLKLVCIVRRKPLYAVWHEVWGLEYWVRYLGPLGLVACVVEYLSVGLPDRIISVSAHTTDRLRTVFERTDGVVTVPNGIDVAAIGDVPGSDRHTDVIFAGRLLSHKNVDVLLRAVAILRTRRPDICVLVVGDGPERARLMRLRRELGLEGNVSFSGFIERHEDLYALMHGSGVFVLPSTREGFGLVAAEANACGLPVVTIDDERNATRDIVIEGKNGTLCPLDAESLSDAIVRMLESRRESEYYVAYAKRYDWDEVAVELKKIYSV